MYTKGMSKSYSVAKARAKLADIVDQAEAGSDVELTRRGKKVAVVMSATRYARLCGRQVGFMTAYEAFREKHNLSEAGVAHEWARELRQKDMARPVKL